MFLSKRLSVPDAMRVAKVGWRALIVTAGLGTTVLLTPAVSASGAEQTSSSAAEDDEDAAESGKENTLADAIQGRINQVFQTLVRLIKPVLFCGVPTGVEDRKIPQIPTGGSYGRTGWKAPILKIPLILLVLVLGGMFFTFRYGFVNLRLFRHSIQVIRGKYDKPDDEGEISHFQALTSALSATVGLGNIAGVAVAIATGGPGALFWMWLIAFFGMSSKFSSCSFAQLYRKVNPDGTILGGPMIYLDEGIRDRFPRLAVLGKVFGILFAVFTVLAAFGGGNLFQGNQTFAILHNQLDVQRWWAWLIGLVMDGEKANFVVQWMPARWLVGLVMATLVGLVIIGGIRRIGEVTSRLVPLMCVFYCTVCLIIIFANVSRVPTMFAEIFTRALSIEAGLGGLIGALIVGGRRAAFSNEAGFGSAAIAHAAAKTKEPVREGIVAMIGPFIDTIVVCTMTALAILITKSHLDPATGEPFAADAAKEKGIELTAAAFGSLADTFGKPGSIAPYLLCIAVFIFAYSTMISWSYYGERAVEYLFGRPGIMPYRIVYVLVVILGPILTLDMVIEFSDMMLFSMAFPNILGMILLSGLLHKHAKDYVRRLRSGEMKPQR